MKFECDRCGDEMPQVELVCMDCDDSDTYDQNRLVSSPGFSYVHETRNPREELLSGVSVVCECGGSRFEMRSATLCPGCEHFVEKSVKA